MGSSKRATHSSTARFTRDDRGGPPMALDEHIVGIAVGIARLLGGELAQAEVVEEEQVRHEPAPHSSRSKELSARD